MFRKKQKPLKIEPDTQTLFQYDGKTFAEMVKEELHKAKAAYPRLQTSAHEGFAVLLEEVEELKAIVWQKQKDRDPRAMLKELVQIGAMAQRMAGEIVGRGKVNED